MPKDTTLGWKFARPKISRLHLTLAELDFEYPTIKSLRAPNNSAIVLKNSNHNNRQSLIWQFSHYIFEKLVSFFLSFHLPFSLISSLLLFAVFLFIWMHNSALQISIRRTMGIQSGTLLEMYNPLRCNRILQSILRESYFSWHYSKDNVITHSNIATLSSSSCSFIGSSWIPWNKSSSVVSLICALRSSSYLPWS